jgi:hypothetical protein
LKTLEKINIKEIRNTLENRKANSTQVGQLSPAPPAPARPWCLTGGSHLSAPTRAPSLPLSLAAPWARFVGAVPLARAPLSLSLSRQPHLSARPQPPAHDPPPWTRPRPRDLRPPSHVLAPFEPRAPLAHLPLLTCALSRTLLSSLSLCARDRRVPPPPTVDCHPVCDRRRACTSSVASVSPALPPDTQDTLWFALPLSGLPGPRSPERFLRSWSPVTVGPRLHRTPAILQASQSSHSR